MRFVVLKRGKERKIENLYPWIFPDDLEDIVGDPKPGDLVNVFSSDRHFLGKAFYGVKKIRMITRKDEELNTEFFRSRIVHALEKRRFEEPYYRAFNAEGDGIPGLVIDRYGEGYVIQLRNEGIERYRDEIVKVLVDLGASFVHLRNDFESEPSEGVERVSETLYGEVPDELIITEGSLRFHVNIKTGQKTGFFFDQRRNRLKVRGLEGEKALDLYTYTGGFALNLAAAGFEVVGVDISEHDLETAEKNAELNGLRVEFIASDAVDYLKNSDGVFDVVVADPPAVIKRKTERKRGIRFFSELVGAISRILKNGGILVLCSCAYHMDLNALLQSLRMGVEGRGIYWRVLDVTFQDVDHPWIVQIPETLYLKCVWAVMES